MTPKTAAIDSCQTSQRFRLRRLSMKMRFMNNTYAEVMTMKTSAFWDRHSEVVVGSVLTVIMGLALGSLIGLYLADAM